MATPWQDVDEAGRGRLHVASVTGVVCAVEELLASWPAVEITRPDRTDDTALHLAAWKGRAGCVSLLLPHFVGQLDAADSNGDSALHLAAHGGHTLTALALLRAGADPLLARRGQGAQEAGGTQTALSLACAHACSIGVVDALLAHGRRAGILPQLLAPGLAMAGSGGSRRLAVGNDAPMAVAICRRQVPAVRRLLAVRPCNSDDRDEAGTTPLLWALGRGKVEIVRLLLGPLGGCYHSEPL